VSSKIICYSFLTSLGKKRREKRQVKRQEDQRQEEHLNERESRI
jgi:hypothetical protein